jgi:hypothetical protein
VSAKLVHEELVLLVKVDAAVAELAERPLLPELYQQVSHWSKKPCIRSRDAPI